MSDTTIDAIIFDHDGTLVDSEKITLSVVAGIAVEAGVEIYPEDIDRFVGASIHTVFEEIERRSGNRLPVDIFEQFRTRQTAEIQNGLQEIVGATELLTALTSPGSSLPIAVASNAPVAKMEICLGATNLARFFPAGHLVSAYDIEAWKPDPAIFLHAAEVLGVDPSRCAVVEDSAPGLDAAAASGMHVFALDPAGRFADRTSTTQLTNLADLLQHLAPRR